MNNIIEIFFDFADENCFILSENVNKIQKQFNKEIKWRSFPAQKAFEVVKSAHIISKWADENNIGDVYRQIVFYSHFVLQKNIEQNEVLKEIMIKTGMYEIKPEYILENEKYVKLFEEDLQQARELGLKDVPVILNNGKVVNNFCEV